MRCRRTYVLKKLQGLKDQKGLIQGYQNLRLYDVSIHRKFYQNRFIDECARKNLAKIP